MEMSRHFALAFLTIPDIAPADAIRIAAEAGYDSVGLRLLPAVASGEGPYPILTDPAVLREARSALSDTGICVGDVEIVRLNAQTKVESFLPFLECAAALGAANILVAGDDPDPKRLIQTFAGFAELAGRYGLTADLEFMPWTGVRDARAALTIVEKAGQANGGVLADALHWDRTGGKIEDLILIPPERIHYFQICDAPKDFVGTNSELIRVARGGRLFPGCGGIDLRAFLEVLPANVPVSVEIASVELNARLTPRERAVQALAATSSLVNSIK